MPSNTSINEEETACVSFALLDALIALLAKRNVISSDEIKAILRSAIQIIEATPKNSNARMINFIRGLSFN
jgi:hypothetical protein